MGDGGTAGLPGGLGDPGTGGFPLLPAGDILVGDLFLIRDGIFGFAPGVLSPDWLPLGPVVTNELLDEPLNFDFLRWWADSFGSETAGGWGEPGDYGYEVRYPLAINGSPYTSFLIFGDLENGIMNMLNELEPDNSEELKKIIEAQLAALGLQKVKIATLMNGGAAEGDGR